MNVKWVAAIGISLFVLFIGTMIGIAIYIQHSDNRCIEQLGPEYKYWGPGKCKKTTEQVVRLP